MGSNLEGMVALVTGSGRGMGRSHANLLAERGADVIVHDINPDSVAETAELVRSNGRRAGQIITDVRNVGEFTAKISEQELELGKIDILVNNAGVSGNKLAVEDITEEIYNNLFDIQVRGSFFAVQAVLPGMKSRKYGKIINISSIYAMGGSSFASHYAAAKSALSGFTKSWAREFALGKSAAMRWRRFYTYRYDAWK